MIKAWYERAWEEYLDWQARDRKTLKRINALLKDIERSHFEGIGRPEPLRGNLAGWWSRRIDDVNRIVYKVENEQLVILQGGTHYDY
jgi:toxin YoeB